MPAPGAPADGADDPRLERPRRRRDVPPEAPPRLRALPRAPLHRALLLPVTAHLALLRGRLRTAHDRLGASLDALTHYGTRPQHPLLIWLVGMLAEVRLSMGRGPEARALLHEHGCLDGPAPDRLHRECG
ncbi:hypothetical protein O1L55_35320 [Streptomyces albulus]|nr:hypothetical protein [Streptomyces noursei]